MKEKETETGAGLSAENNSSVDYQADNRKPSKKHQFKKGKSGNSSERPKQSKKISDLITEKLEEKVLILKFLDSSLKKTDLKTAKYLLEKDSETAATDFVAEEHDLRALEEFLGRIDENK